VILGVCFASNWRIIVQIYANGKPALARFFCGLMPAVPAARPAAPIDRHARVTRHNIGWHPFDAANPPTVGNGGSACTVDATDRQTFPEAFLQTPPLGTRAVLQHAPSRELRYYLSLSHPDEVPKNKNAPQFLAGRFVFADRFYAPMLAISSLVSPFTILNCWAVMPVSARKVSLPK
jgi:hypothetical protein